MSRKRLIIIGGGYAGFELAKELDTTLDVTLIERKPAFVHVAASIRALVDPTILTKIMLPYDALLKKGRTIQDNAASINGKTVTLDSGESVTGDFIVVATGSSYAAPFKPHGNTVDTFADASKDTHAKLKEAQSIAIIGGGVVGLELAGEIATAMPGKKITLIVSTPSLLPHLPAKLGTAVARKLKKLGVELRFNLVVNDLGGAQAPFTGSVALSDGSTLTADLIVPAIGAKPETGLLKDLPGVDFTSNGQAVSDPWLRPTELPHIFAIGDVVASGDAMTIVAVARQVPWLAKTLKALALGKKIEKLPAYKPWPLAPLLIPFGPKTGHSLLPVSKNGWVAGDFLTSKIKGKEIFIPKYQKAFGLTK